MVRVLIEKKSTAPNSANVSIATKDNPATIAGLAAGNINEYKDLNFEKPKLFLDQLGFEIDTKMML